MRKSLIRSFASILIWIGAVEIVASFLCKMLLHFQNPLPFSPLFFGVILLGILLLVVVRI